MAQADYFLKIDQVPGESTDAKHKDEIEVESWSWGATQVATASTGGGGTSGRVSIQDFNFVAHTSKASPVLFVKCASGEHIGKESLRNNSLNDVGLCRADSIVPVAVKQVWFEVDACLLYTSPSPRDS